MSVEYYRKYGKLFESQVTVEVTVATTRVPGQSTTHVPSVEYSQLSRPLFWMSVLLMLVVLVYTIVVVVLCFTPRFRKLWRPTCALRSHVSAIPPAAPAEDGVTAARREGVDDDADADNYDELTSVITSRE